MCNDVPETSNPGGGRRGGTGVDVGNLSVGILMPLLEHIGNLEANRETLRNCRVVSKKLGFVAGRVLFRSVRLTPKHLADHAELNYARTFDNMAKLTEHVDIPTDLDMVRVGRFLERLPKLATVNFFYTGPVAHEGVELPCLTLAVHEYNPILKHVRVSIEGLPVRRFPAEDQDHYIDTIPALMLDSLSMGSYTGSLERNWDATRRLVVQAKNLRAFSLDNHGLRRRFLFRKGERMPAIRSLNLTGYFWNHRYREVRDHWNFSRIQDLVLKNVPMLPFLQSVDFSDLRDVRRLHLSETTNSAEVIRSFAGSITMLLHALVHDYVRRLESLSIQCEMKLFRISALLKHRHSLRSVRVNDFTGRIDDVADDRTVELGAMTLSTAKLIGLSAGLEQLVALDIDVTRQQLLSPEHLSAFTRFRNLRRLTLHAPTFIKESDVMIGGVDRDFVAVTVAFALLAAGKCQRRGKTVPRWERVTIHIGGSKLRGDPALAYPADQEPEAELEMEPQPGMQPPAFPVDDEDEGWSSEDESMDWAAEVVEDANDQLVPRTQAPPPPPELTVPGRPRHNVYDMTLLRSRGYAVIVPAYDCYYTVTNMPLLLKSPLPIARDHFRTLMRHMTSHFVGAGCNWHLEDIIDLRPFELF